MEVHKLYLVLTVCFGSVLSQEFNGECYVDGEPRRCEPVRMSFSLEQTATASSTCGTVPTPFCVRSTSLGRISSDCTGGDICDANDPENAHPAAYLTDFPLIGTWWQSENSLNPGTSVSIDIPLLTLAEITVITFDFRTIKPSGFYIERSTDYGETYQPYHFFAVSCLSQYGIDPDAELTAMNETAVRCQTINEPPVSGVISFFPAIDRPSANDSVPGYSEALYLFATATNIRVILDQHYELDLAQEDPGYYYALEDINVVGSCQCYGHASGCTRNAESGAYECACRHNTTGTYCEQCQEFYQDVPWQRADGSGPFECKSKCVFSNVLKAFVFCAQYSWLLVGAFRMNNCIEDIHTSKALYILLYQRATATTTVMSACLTLWCMSKQDRRVEVCVLTVVGTLQEGSVRRVPSSSIPDQTENRLMKMCVQVGEGSSASYIDDST